jgi:hypothetical protein
LIIAGVLALAGAAVVGCRWYYGLHSLHTVGGRVEASVSMAVGQSHVIDELLGARGSADGAVNLRKVSVRLADNTAGATAQVELCMASGPGAASPTPGNATCAAPAPFVAGHVYLDAERIVVRVRASRPGGVVVAGVDVSYQQGVRHATQHVGPSVTVAVRP